MIMKFILILKSYFFYDREKENILNNAVKGIRRELKNIDDDGYDLLVKFLQVDPDKRILAEDALNILILMILIKKLWRFIKKKKCGNIFL